MHEPSIAQVATRLVGLLQGDQADEAVARLLKLYPNVRFDFDPREGLSIFYPSYLCPSAGVAPLPKVLKFHAKYLFEVKPEGICVIKNIGENLIGSSLQVVRLFQRASGLPDDGVWGPVTAKAVREFATRPSRWEKLMSNGA